MAFPFYKNIDGYITKELKARSSSNNVQLSKLVPWIRATSNLGGQYTLGTESYSTLFDGKGTDAYRNGGGAWKYRPNPIITDFSVDFASRGTLRRCTLTIKCFSPAQLETIQEYFLEPGISTFIQWGWNYSVSTGKSIGPLAPSAANVNLYNRDAVSLNSIRSANAGCYDNFVGIITGGASSIAGEEFTVQVKMCSMGEILMGRNSEAVTDDKKIEPFSYPTILYDSHQAAKDPMLNFAYFYDQLPDEYRIPTTYALGSSKIFKPESDFLNYNESLVEEAKSETTEGWFSGNLSFQGKTFKALDSDTPVNGNKFVSFDAFIKLLNNTRVQLTGGAIAIKIDISDTYIGAFQSIFSTDERIFIPNSKTYNYLNDIPALGGGMPATLDTSVGGRSFPKTSSSTVKANGETFTLAANTHGWIGDVYIENEMAMEALRDQTSSIKDILDAVLKKMEEAVEGLWAFQILEDKDGKSVKLRIADANLVNLRNGDKGSHIETYSMYGTDSFFLDASFELDIPKAMASKVFMEKSTSATSPDELTGLFSNKKDTILEKPSIAKPEEKKETTEEKEERKWVEFRRNVKLLINPKITQISEIGDGNMDEWVICGQYLNKRKFNEIKKKETGYESSGQEVYNGRPLPVSFSFTILGMSGFQVGHLYKINGLPEQYNNGRGAFQVEEITHKIDSKQWITEVTGKYRPFYK